MNSGKKMDLKRAGKIIDDYSVFLQSSKSSIIPYYSELPYDRNIILEAIMFLMVNEGDDLQKRFALNIGIIQLLQAIPDPLKYTEILETKRKLDELKNM